MSSPCSKLLTDLQGALLSGDVLRTAVEGIYGVEAIEASAFANFAASSDGHENNFASHSGRVQVFGVAQGCLESAEEHSRERTKQPWLLFLKRTVLPRDPENPHTYDRTKLGSWTDKRRSLMYGRNEARFYTEFAAELAAKGVRTPKLGFVQQEFSILDAETDSSKETEPASVDDLVAWLDKYPSPGCILALESFEMGGSEPWIAQTSPSQAPSAFLHQTFLQQSPLQTEARVLQALAAIADLHAAAWENKELLRRASTRLQRYGGSFHLRIRNPKEISKLVPNWERFLVVFQQEATAAFCESATESNLEKAANTQTEIAQVGKLNAIPERIQQLGVRLLEIHSWVSDQLSAEPDSPCATLIHGDFKAMNILLHSSVQNSSVLIDFAQTGVGYGMSDVAFLLAHSVSPELLDTAESQLVEGYLSMLREHGVEYTDPKQAWFHYYLGVLDYGRFLIARFWGDASEGTFAKKENNPNVTLPNRSVVAALRFAKNLDRCLTLVEELR